MPEWHAILKWNNLCLNLVDSINALHFTTIKTLTTKLSAKFYAIVTSYSVINFADNASMIIRAIITRYIWLTSCLDLPKQVNLLLIDKKQSTWSQTSHAEGQMYSDSSPYKLSVLWRAITRLITFMAIFCRQKQWHPLNHIEAYNATRLLQIFLRAIYVRYSYISGFWVNISKAAESKQVNQ